MSDVPDSVIHWLLGLTVPAGGALFLFLLKRTFADFENKISDLFSQMKDSFKAQQSHDTQLQLHDQRITQLEKKRVRR